MPVLLQLDSSSAGDASVSRRLTAEFATRWRERGADHTVVSRDLHAEALPHLPHASLHWPPRLRPAGAPAFPEAETRQSALIDELLGADALVVGAPMYNYSLPSTLKAWVDHIHVPGLTAPFDVDSQPLRGKTAVIVTTRGAIYDQGSATENWDHTVPPLRIILESALGMRVETVAVSRTLALSVPAMAGERAAFDAEYAAAQRELARLAAAL
ncbi:NAD(P)H-dependent oxidoreductase [Gryllotalpicola kribbensis]|jgi:FMN-dependent NADH-azoreductase|uniref:FMN dependent NADH:quinone oxidoreductase n=1 Tax=Gryllotalpicola kribbensis TaxID=993084 RepID=A0ABP8ASX9_9MICO